MRSRFDDANSVHLTETSTYSTPDNRKEMCLLEGGPKDAWQKQNIKVCGAIEWKYTCLNFVLLWFRTFGLQTADAGISTCRTPDTIG